MSVVLRILAAGSDLDSARAALSDGSALSDLAIVRSGVPVLPGDSLLRGWFVVRYDGFRGSYVRRHGFCWDDSLWASAIASHGYSSLHSAADVSSLLGIDVSSPYVILCWL